jgi:hypothetical protein
MIAAYLKRGLAVGVLCLFSNTTAFADVCGDASAKYNRIVDATNTWYTHAYERATGAPFTATVPAQSCRMLLPVFRERFRKERAALEAYGAWKSACPYRHEDLSEHEGIKVAPVPVVTQKIMAQIQMCEGVLSTRTQRLDAA